MRLVARMAAAIGVAACTLLLAGCRVQGTVDVLSAEQLSVDLLLVGDEAPCDVAFQSPRLAYTQTTDSTGALACRVTGMLDVAYLSAFELSVSDVGEYWVFRADESRRRSWPDGALTLRFPGDVQSSSLGTISGSTVRINDLPALSDGIEVVALSRRGPSDKVLWAAGGLAIGLGATLLVVLARVGGRRLAAASRATAAEVLPAIPLTDGDGADAPGADPAATADTAHWARPPDRADARAPDGPSDPRPRRDDRRFAPPEDHDFWAAPAPDGEGLGHAGPGDTGR